MHHLLRKKINWVRMRKNLSIGSGKKVKHNPSNAPSKNRMYPMQQSKQNNFKILS
jgi:hypothetical protein